VQPARGLNSAERLCGLGIPLSSGGWIDLAAVCPTWVQIVADLERQGVGFESLTEQIETGSAAGKLVFHVFAALAEFERGLIRERTQAGLAAARARGRTGGRKPKLDAKQIRQIKALLRDPNTSVAEVARDYGVSRTTIYKYCGVVPPSELIEGTT